MYKEEKLMVSETYLGDQLIGRDTIGSIKVDSEIYKKAVILIKMNEFGYVDAEKIKTIFDYFYAQSFLRENGYHGGGLVMGTMPCFEGELFVDSDTLQPYFQELDQPKDVSIRRLRQEVKRSKKNKTN